jgi:hypothetical protein
LSDAVLQSASHQSTPPSRAEAHDELRKKDDKLLFKLENELDDSDLTIDFLHNNNPRDFVSDKELQVLIGIVYMLDFFVSDFQQALNELKQNGCAQGLSDKYLMIFLFARKLDVKRTIDMVTANKVPRLIVLILGFDFPIHFVE